MGAGIAACVGDRLPRVRPRQRTRSFTDEQNGRLRAACFELKQRYGSIKKLAQVIGIAQPTLQTFMSGDRKGLAFPTAEAIAELLGMSVVELLYGKSEPRLRLCDQPGYSEALEKAKQMLPLKPGSDWIWEAVGNKREEIPRGGMPAALLKDLAVLYLTYELAQTGSSPGG